MNEETLFSLLVDLHSDGERQGPGSESETLRALSCSHIDFSAPLKVADIGCGSGASTLTLAKHLPNAAITAVDLFPQFLDKLISNAKALGLESRINTLEKSMDELPFQPEEFDLIWSEGAIYNIGFKNGLELWKPFLKAEGILAVSEITWLRPNPPQRIKEHWESEYPEISTASEKIRILEAAGYDLIGYSTLPPSNWLENYYEPTQSRIEAFAQQHSGIAEAKDVIVMERDEYELYMQYKEWFSYGFYVAAKRPNTTAA